MVPGGVKTKVRCNGLAIRAILSRKFFETKRTSVKSRERYFVDSSA